MDMVLGILRWVASLLFTLVAPLILIVIGALIVGYGAYLDWSWVVNGGVIVAAIGVFWTFRIWGGHD